MKLLFVQDSLGTGGAERSNLELWYFLREKVAIEIKIVVLEHRKEGIEKEVLASGLDVIFLMKGSYLFQVNELRKIIEEYKPTIVHSVLWRSVSRVRIAHTFGSFLHVESLVNCGYSKIRYKDPGVNKIGLTFFKYLNRISHPVGTDGFIAISEEVKKHGMKYLKIPEEKIEVIPRGRKANSNGQKREEIRKQLKKELEIQGSARLFVHVGRQEYAKGHLVLLQALEQLKEKLLELNVHFLLCGRKGNSTPDLQKFQEEHEIPNLHWLGHRSDVEQILAASDVFVFPSLSEGLGGALIEAQAAKLPIICSDIPVFEEVVVKDENALMYEVGNYEELGHRILELADSPEMRLTMGEKSLDNFQRKFRIEGVHERILNYYQTICT